MGDVLIYRPAPGDKESDYYHVLFMDVNFQLKFKADDGWTDLDIVHIAFYDNYALIASESALRVTDLDSYGIDRLLNLKEKELKIEEVKPKCNFKPLSIPFSIIRDRLWDLLAPGDLLVPLSDPACP